MASHLELIHPQPPKLPPSLGVSKVNKDTGGRTHSIACPRPSEVQHCSRFSQDLMCEIQPELTRTNENKTTCICLNILLLVAPQLRP